MVLTALTIAVSNGTDSGLEDEWGRGLGRGADQKIV
jgi:hypothetical protein